MTKKFFTVHALVLDKKLSAFRRM